MRKRREKRDQDGIYERRDGKTGELESPYWWATWAKPGGGTARRSTGVRIADDPRGHEAKRARARMMVGEGIEQAAQEKAMAGRTWDEMILEYQDGPAYAGKALETQKRERDALKNLFPAFTGRDLTGIDGVAVRAYIAVRQDAGDSNGTIAREIAMMSSITNWAIRDLEWEIPNPWTGRKPKAAPPRERWLSDDEVARLLDAAEVLARQDARAAHLPDFIRLCLYAGLRKGEALGLEWRRVDLDRGIIHFGAGDQKSRKVGAIPINQQARIAILSRERVRVVGSPWVFAHPDGSRVKSVRSSFDSAVEAAGLVDVHQHDLRRTFGGMLDKEGVPIQQISKLMRHSSVAVTARVYVHSSAETLAEAAGVLDRDQPKLKAVK